MRWRKLWIENWMEWSVEVIMSERSDEWSVEVFEPFFEFWPTVWRLPSHLNHLLLNMDRVTWLKTLWQYNFKSPAHLKRMSFIVHYQKFKEFWIWKYVAKIFLIFQAFFINLWSRASIANFGTSGPVFKSCLYFFFFLVKMLV